MKRILAMVGAAVMLVTIVPATFAASPVKPPSQATASIVGIAAGNPAFSTLVTAVTCADPAVLQALTSGEQLTVFAPTNDAFAKLGLNDKNICSALPQGALTQILLYHVEDGRHFSNSVLPKKAGQMKTIHTLLGQSFRVSSTGAISTTGGNTANIVTANINATNGVIHVIDSVLLPVL